MTIGIRTPVLAYDVIQPIRWPAYPAPGRVIVGRTIGPYSRETYCHLGPLVLSVKDDGRGPTFEVHIFRSRWQVNLSLRLRGSYVP